MARKSFEELQEIMKREGCERIWSWSKVNSFHTSTYEWFLHYVKKAKPDNDNSIYVVTGGLSHDILEKYYTGQIKYEEMINEFEDGWSVAVDLADLKFDRCDEIKNDSIKNKYYQNLIHFFTNHKPFANKPILEQFVKIKIGKNLFQGYIDSTYKDNDGNFHIIDFKTSSIYKGAKAENECGQLVLYAIGLNQAGIPLDKIRIAWNFLKYVSVECEQKNGKVKTREIERCKIGESLKASAKTWLKHFDYDVDEYIDRLIETNDIECLPDEVREKFSISDCYVYVSLTEELVNKWTKYIVDTITDIELREKDYQETHNDKVWWDTDESLKAQSYYFANLCSYSRRLHKPYDEYCKKIEEQKNGGVFGDMFGSNTFGNTNNDSDSVSSSNEVTEDVLSWLDNIEL